MIVLNGVSRWYGQVVGVNEVTCTIGQGVTALLGPNGAGKSTMMKLITGQIRPSAGTIGVLGMAPFANPHVYRKLGYCPESESAYDDLTGREFVTMCAYLSQMPGNAVRGSVGDAIDRVGMTLNADRKIGGYSKGMRQRIKIAQGIVHDPAILVMDEPLNGLDPVARRDITTLLRSLGAAGKCVLVSSHILYEVEQMTTHIVMIHKGRVQAHGDIYSIRNLIDRHPHRILIHSPQARMLAQAVLGIPFVLSAKLDGADARSVEIETRSPDAFYSAFPAFALANRFTIEQFGSPDNNLEAVFNYLTS